MQAFQQSAPPMASRSNLKARPKYLDVESPGIEFLTLDELGPDILIVHAPDVPCKEFPGISFQDVGSKSIYRLWERAILCLPFLLHVARQHSKSFDYGLPYSDKH